MAESESMLSCWKEFECPKMQQQKKHLSREGKVEATSYNTVLSSFPRRLTGTIHVWPQMTNDANNFSDCDDVPREVKYLDLPNSKPEPKKNFNNQAPSP